MEQGMADLMLHYAPDDFFRDPPDLFQRDVAMEVGIMAKMPQA
jgi:hypothetical protein